MGLAFLYFHRERRARIWEEPRVLRIVPVDSLDRHSIPASDLQHVVQRNDHRVRPSPEPRSECDKLRASLRNHETKIPEARSEFPLRRDLAVPVHAFQRILHGYLLRNALLFLHLLVLVRVPLPLRSDRACGPRRQTLREILRIRVHTPSDSDPRKLCLRAIEWHVLGCDSRLPYPGSVPHELLQCDLHARSLLVRGALQHCRVGRLQHRRRSHPVLARPQESWEHLLLAG